MARQRDVIGAREFPSQSWYRRIGENRYRFTVTHKTEKGRDLVQMRADRFVSWGKPWARVHDITLPR